MATLVNMYMGKSLANFRGTQRVRSSLIPKRTRQMIPNPPNPRGHRFHEACGQHRLSGVQEIGFAWSSERKPKEQHIFVYTECPLRRGHLHARNPKILLVVTVSQSKQAIKIMVPVLWSRLKWHREAIQVLKRVQWLKAPRRRVGYLPSGEAGGFEDSDSRILIWNMPCGGSG